MQLKHIAGLTAALFLCASLAGCGTPEGEAVPPGPAGEEPGLEETAGGSSPDASSAGEPEESDETQSGTAGEWSVAIKTRDLAGNEVTQADFSQNTLTMMNVWATWCPPCVGELPELQAISAAYAERGVQVVGVLEDGFDKDGNPDEAKLLEVTESLESMGVGYLMILPDDTMRELLLSQMQYFPTTFFFDSTGTIVQTEIGAKDEAQWSKVIDGILDEMAQ